MSERPEPTPVALYARVSSDRQDVDLSVAAQLRALRDYAEKNGHVVAREYVDEAESGWVDDRPQFNKMIEEARSPDAAFREIFILRFALDLNLCPNRPVGQKLSTWGSCTLKQSPLSCADLARVTLVMTRHLCHGLFFPQHFQG